MSRMGPGMAAPQAEDAVIGGVMLDNSMLPVASARLTAEDFHSRDHQAYFRAMVALDADGEPIDLVTMQHALQEQGNGGRNTTLRLAEILESTPSAANTEAYIAIVRDAAIRRGLVFTCQTTTERAMRGADATEILDYAQAAVMGLAESRAGGPQPVMDLMPGFLDALEARTRHDNHVVGLPSGYTDFDRMTSGFQDGNLVIVGGRPSMGKTALAMNIAEHVAVKERRPVVVFSLEMSHDELLQRMVSGRARVPFAAIRNGRLSDADWPRISAATTELREAPLHIDDSAVLSVMDVRARARQIHHRTPLGLVVVDYLQLMSGEADTRDLAIGEMSRALKRLAKELGCPVMAVSQLNRGVEQRADKRPMLSDLRESGNIEQDADLILFVYRDEVYHQDAPKGVAELILAKHRNGPTGNVPLTFLGQFTRFENTAAPAASPPPDRSDEYGGFAE